MPRVRITLSGYDGFEEDKVVEVIVAREYLSVFRGLETGADYEDIEFEVIES